MKSIRKRLFLIFMLFMLILVAGNMMINISLFKEYYMKQAKKRMADTSNEIQKNYYENKESMQDYIEMIDGTWGIWVRIVDKDFNITYTSRPEKTTKTVLSKWAVKAIEEGKNQIEKNGVYFTAINREEDNIVRLACITKLHDEDSDSYIVLSRSIKSVYENIETANRLVEVTALILCAVGAVFIFYFSKSITKPILDISKHAKEISKLNFSHKLDIHSDNEIGVLAESINEISDKLSFSIEGLKKDIDERKQLVRNMSHELKTPISAVKGYAEGLKYAVADTPEKMNKYCDVIIMECNKMDHLVKDILELSTMERVEWQIEKKNVPVKQLIEGIWLCFSEQLKRHYIQFEIEGEEACFVYGDYDLIERAAFNYIENAIRYTGVSGRIKVSFANAKRGFLFRVFNTGSSISEKEIENIWNVFYKTDKSRTREDNNYGVGLAIVKANIKLHEGEVYAENKEDGVEFSFWIPS